MPIPARNTNGINQLSKNSSIAATASTTAMATYTASSRSHRSRRSVTMAEMPETRQFFPAIARIFPIASMVSSAEPEVSKNTATSVSLSALKA